MSDWKDLFQEHILDRGESYYFDGAVLELHKTNSIKQNMDIMGL